MLYQVFKYFNYQSFQFSSREMNLDSSNFTGNLLIELDTRQTRKPNSKGKWQ